MGAVGGFLFLAIFFGIFGYVIYQLLTSKDVEFTGDIKKNDDERSFGIGNNLSLELDLGNKY